MPVTISAADVKRLRDETDAPMMECKAALEEAGGDFEKAKQILREKGKAAAAKRSDRATAEGCVAFWLSPDAKKAGGVVLECETDFVAKNADFVATTSKLAELVRDSGITDTSDESYRSYIEDLANKTRENVRLAKAVQLKSDSPIATYLHHDRKTGVAVLSSGEGAGGAAVRQVAIHAAWARPEFLTKDELPQDKMAAEIEIETRRALNEGKPESIAKNIAQGRVNKEFVRRVVLMEQAFYSDQGITVAQYLAQHAKGVSITGFAVLAVGQG